MGKKAKGLSLGFTPKTRITAMLALLLLFASIAYCAPVPRGTPTSVYVTAYAYDMEGHTVPDAQIIVNYQKDGNKSEINGVAQGLTGGNGQYRTLINFAGNITRPNYVIVTLYTPFWSAEPRHISLPQGQNVEVGANFTIDMFYGTYRVKVTNADGTPASGIGVRILEPMLLFRKTNSQGIAQFRFPQNYSVSGQIEYSDREQGFDFKDAIEEQGRAKLITVKLPLANSTPMRVNITYDWSFQAFTQSDRVMEKHEIDAIVLGKNITYITDTNGYAHMINIPEQKITLYWSLYNVTYNQTVDLAQPPRQIRTPILLKINKPEVISLGESCYRVTVNITDPRPDAIRQVRAKTTDDKELLPFTMERSAAELNGTLVFYRIVCVIKDTDFYIIAANQYENASVHIQLMKSGRTIQPEKNTNVQAIADIPQEDTSKIEQQRKLELVVILAELLFFLIILYVVLRFRGVVIYYFQSILRFAYYFVRTALTGIAMKGAQARKGAQAGGGQQAGGEQMPSEGDEVLPFAKEGAKDEDLGGKTKITGDYQG